jgi:hypothetical protein
MVQRLGRGHVALTTPKLGIWIPTWNRPHFFNRLIEQIAEQRHPDVQVKIGLEPQNENYKIPEWCEVVTNSQRLGCTRNVMQGMTAVESEYLWIIGDDEQIREGAINEVLERIASKPGMVICTDGVFDHGPTNDYNSWVEWMDACVDCGRQVMLTAHTLNTSTVFRRQGVNIELAEAMEETRYGYHFGILDGLMHEPVSITRKPIFIAGSCNDSSIFAETPEYLNSHGSVTQTALRQLVRFASQKAEREYPESSYIPGVGFDSPK